MKFAKIIPLGPSGFLVLINISLDIYEWDDDLETLIKTGLLQNEALKSPGALGVSAKHLGC